jgi:hypothetical protein
MRLWSWRSSKWSLDAAQIIGDTRFSIFNGEFKSSLATSATIDGEIKFASGEIAPYSFHNLLFKDKFALAATRSLQISMCP